MKARTVGAKRRAKKSAKGVAELYDSFEKEALPIQVAEKDDPQQTVREARARQLGKSEKEVMDPMFAFPVGRAIDAGARDKEEARSLYDLYWRFYAARRTFCRSIGVQLEPAVSKLEFMPERFETNADLPPPDPRTEEERHEAAKKRWQDHDHLLGFLAPRERYAIDAAIYGRSTLYDGGITVHGQTFVASMRVLQDVVETVENRK